jgi:hypothetical protein
MRRLVSLAVVSALGISALIGCSQPRPMVMAPPVSQNSGYAAPQPGYGASQPGMGTMATNAPTGGVFQWQDVPANQEVPVMRATFDQGGYQIFAQSGETIVVPFVNNNLYVMKFGRTNSQSFFRNENGVPTLYLRPGEGLENASAQGARWYPIPQDYGYSQPMYVALAPTWNDYANMGWYPGMTYYGGMWGYSPYSHFSWMPGFYINIGGRRYTDYNNYYSYYRSTPGYVRNSVVYHNYNTTRSVGSRSFGSTGSYRPSGGSTGSFGAGRVGGSTGTFGSRPATSTGSFGSGRSTFGSGASSTLGSGRSTFGGGSSSGSGSASGTFGSRPSGGSAFGSRPAGSSFGGGSSGYSSPGRTGGSSFGSGRSTGSSFGGGSGRSSGSSSGGSSGRSSGSFGGSRRR